MRIGAITTKIALVLVVLAASTAISLRIFSTTDDADGAGALPTETPSPAMASTPTQSAQNVDVASALPSATELPPGYVRQDGLEHPTAPITVTCEQGADPVVAGPMFVALYQPLKSADNVGGRDDATIRLSVGAFPTEKESSLTTRWSSAPAQCPYPTDLGPAYDARQQKSVKIPPLDSLVSPSIVYQARAVEKDAGTTVKAVRTALQTVSNGWYLEAVSMGTREVMDLLLPIVAAKLDAQLHTHFLATAADDYPSATPSKTQPADRVTNTSFGTLITDPECDAIGVAFDPNGQTVFADITGDGYLDAFASYSCTSTTSSPPAKIYVFDGRHTRATRPRQIAALAPGEGYYLRDISVTVNGPVVHLHADNLSRSAPLCCPDQVLDQDYTWNGSKFVASNPIVTAHP